MRWKDESSKRPYVFDCFIAKELVYNAYREGFINWNVCNRALEKIASNMNGSWMFGDDWNNFIKNWDRINYGEKIK